MVHRSTPLLLSLMAGLAFSNGACSSPSSEGDARPESSPTPGQCQASTVHRIDRPLSMGTPSPTFSLAYEYKPPRRKDAPTIVHLQGGPGQTQIGLLPFEPYPLDYGLLAFDPRGTGCNRDLPPHDPELVFRSEELAGDVVATLQSLGLTNYVVRGISYGTLLGTHVVHALEHQEVVPPPRALILEGVLGRAFQRGEVVEGYTRAWNRATESLPPPFRWELSQKTPFGVDERTWGSWFLSKAGIGLVGSATSAAEAQLLTLANQGDEGRSQLAKAMIVRGSPFLENSDIARSLYAHIWCHEIDDAQPSNSLLVLEQGQMVAGGALGTYCQKRGLSLDRPFDAARFPLRTPTYYFQSDGDPNTPLSLAQHHWEHNDKATFRQVVLVHSAQHNALRIQMNSCAEAVMASIAEGVPSMQDALLRCGPMTKTVASAAAGEPLHVSPVATAPSPTSTPPTP